MRPSMRRFFFIPLKKASNGVFRSKPTTGRTQVGWLHFYTGETNGETDSCDEQKAKIELSHLLVTGLDSATLQ